MKFRLRSEYSDSDVSGVKFRLQAEYSDSDVSVVKYRLRAEYSESDSDSVVLSLFVQKKYFFGLVLVLLRTSRGAAILEGRNEEEKRDGSCRISYSLSHMPALFITSLT